jgi:hypothetical protein
MVSLGVTAAVDYMLYRLVGDVTVFMHAIPFIVDFRKTRNTRHSTSRIWKNTVVESPGSSLENVVTFELMSLLT